MNRHFLLLCCGLLVSAEMVAVSGAQDARPEVTLSTKEIARLDIFEDRALSSADAVFNLEKYADAGAQYADFLQKHKGAPATAYAVLRKGRCAELVGQRADAIKDYEAVVSRFGKSAKYAPAALFYLSDCHRRNGDSEKAAEAKKLLLENKDYGKSPFAVAVVSTVPNSTTNPSATAPVKLTLAEYEQLALSAPAAENEALTEAVTEAIGKVFEQHVRTEPNEEKLRDFYKRLNKDLAKEPEKTLAYWLWVADGIGNNSKFAYNATEEREKFFQQWLALMKDRFPSSDDYQIAIIHLHYGSERDRSKFTARLDKLFQNPVAAHVDPKNPELDLKKPNWRRILKWVAAHKGNYTKTREYVAMFTYEICGMEGLQALMHQLAVEQNESYLARSTFQKISGTLPYDKLSNKDLQKLIAMAYGTVKDVTTAKKLTEKLDFDKMSEKEKLTLAREFRAIDGALARRVYDQLQDQVVGKLELFHHYVEQENASMAIVFAGQLAEIEKYSAEFSMKKAEMLVAEKRYADAAIAFQQCDVTVEILWRIVACHVAIGETDKAVEQLRTIEKTYRKQAAKAALRIGALYGAADADGEVSAVNKAKQIAVLQSVVKKYPNAKEANLAEGLLGDLGVPPSLPTDTVFEF
jgi:TolA-binding protein